MWVIFLLFFYTERHIEFYVAFVIFCTTDGLGWLFFMHAVIFYVKRCATVRRAVARRCKFICRVTLEIIKTNFVIRIYGNIIPVVKCRLDLAAAVCRVEYQFGITI